MGNILTGILYRGKFYQLVDPQGVTTGPRRKYKARKATTKTVIASSKKANRKTGTKSKNWEAQAAST